MSQALGMNMRQVILDTETTGLEPASGHRIIEIGCIELKDRRRTDRVLHYFINPEREIEKEAIEIHGITEEQLEGEPVFEDIADRFIEFIRIVRSLSIMRRSMLPSSMPSCPASEMDGGDLRITAGLPTRW